MRPLALLCLIFLTGCDQSLETPEQRFINKDLPRFVMTRDTTAQGFPDLILIRDTKTTNEVLFMNYENHCTAILLK
jgi:hypothetical protein